MMTYTHKIIQTLDPAYDGNEGEAAKWKLFLVDLAVKHRKLFEAAAGLYGHVSCWEQTGIDLLKPILAENFNIIDVVEEVSERYFVFTVTFKSERDFLYFKLKYL